MCPGGLATAAGFPGKADQSGESPALPAHPSQDTWLEYVAISPPEFPADPWACPPALDLRAGGRGVGSDWEQPSESCMAAAPVDRGWDARSLAKTSDSRLSSDPHHPTQLRAGSCEVQRKWQGIGLQR